MPTAFSMLIPLQEGRSPLGRLCLLLCGFALLAFAACGLPGEPIGLAFVVGEKVPVHIEPDRQSAVVRTFPRGARLEIVKRDIADKKLGPRTNWYAIKLAEDKFAYLSYDEELVRQNVTSFRPLNPEDPKAKNWGLVVADRLNVRVGPGVSSPIIKSVERNVILEVVAVGSLEQKIRELDGVWLQIRDANTKEGYVFSAHIQRDQKPALEELARSDYRPLKGWLRITAERPTYFTEPGVTKLPASRTQPVEGEPPLCGVDDFPKKGGYAPATMARTFDKQRYVAASLSLMDPSGMVPLCIAELVWIPADQAAVVTDFYKDTLERAPLRANPALLEEVNRAIGGNLNVLDVQLTSVALAPLPGTEKPVADLGRSKSEPGSPGKIPADAAKAAKVAKGEQTPSGAKGTGGPTTVGELDPVGPEMASCAVLQRPDGEPTAEGKGSPSETAATGKNCRRYIQAKTTKGPAGPKHTVFLFERDGRFSTVGVFETAGNHEYRSTSLRTVDIDGDGTMEVVTTESERASTDYNIFALSKGRFRPLLNVAGDGEVGFAVHEGHVILRIYNSEHAPDYTSRKPFDKRFAKREYRVLHYQKGRLAEVDGSKLGIDFGKLEI